MRLLLFLFALTSFILVNFSTNAQDQVSVSVRIEGPKNTLLEAVILTRPKKVTTASGGTHTCDGTNNKANVTPGPTMTSSLDIAATLNSFTWDG